jgi:hypothetical protein
VTVREQVAADHPATARSQAALAAR